MKTPNLELSELTEADTAAFEGVNDTFWALDAIVQLGVLSRQIGTPPDDARQGDRYIVPLGAGGIFAGQTHKVAYLTVEGWRFRTPRPGWTAFVLDERLTYTFLEIDWQLNTGGNVINLPDFSGGWVSTAEFAIDYALGAAHEVVLAGDTSISVRNALAGKVCRTFLIVHQSLIGGFNLTWPLGTFWPGGRAPAVDTSPFMVNVYEVVTVDGGVQLYARLLAKGVYNEAGAPLVYPTLEDPYWPYVVHLLEFEGTDGSTDFIDERGTAITVVGDAEITTDEKRFGVSSGSFHQPSNFGTGVGANWLQIAGGPLNDFSTGDFCIEAFVKLKALELFGGGPLGGVIAMKGTATSKNRITFSVLFNGLQIQFDQEAAPVFHNPKTWNPQPENWLSTTAWSHVAFERRDGIYFMLMNGFAWSEGIAYPEEPFDFSDGDFYIGGGVVKQNDSSVFYGGANLWIDEFRYTRGRARYAPPLPALLPSQDYYGRYTPPELAFSQPTGFVPPTAYNHTGWNEIRLDGERVGEQDLIDLRSGRGTRIRDEGTGGITIGAGPMVPIVDASNLRRISADDLYEVVHFTANTDISHVIPESDTTPELEIGAFTGGRQLGLGTVEVSIEGLDVLTTPQGLLPRTRAIGSAYRLHKIDATTWCIDGDLESA